MEAWRLNAGHTISSSVVAHAARVVSEYYRRVGESTLPLPLLGGYAHSRDMHRQRFPLSHPNRLPSDCRPAVFHCPFPLDPLPSDRHLGSLLAFFGRVVRQPSSMDGTGRASGCGSHG